MHLFQAEPICNIPVEIPLKKLSELDVSVGIPQEGNIQKMNFTSETAGLVSQNILIE